jgi:hypothetical protein
MAITYDTLGSTVTVHPTGTVAPGQLNTAVAIVGGYDSANADSGTNVNEATVVNTTTEAENEFGTDSELAYQARLAFANGATAVHGVPLDVTSTTETFTSTQNGTLSSAPVLDPEVHISEDITAQDTTAGDSVTVNIVYGAPSQPSESNTINLNPETGDWEADESADYDITVQTADYTTAIENAVTETVRAVGVCTESDSPKTNLQTELGTQASNFRFKRGVVGADVDIDPGSTGTYTPHVEDRRLVEVAPARGESPSGKVRLVGAIAGMIASQPIDVTGSITYDTVSGLDSLKTDFTPLQAESFEQVTAVTDQFEVAEGVTTSAESSFADIYKVEIIDLIVEQLYERIRNFRGGSNSRPARRVFKSRLKRTLGAQSVPNAQPPLLASGDGTQPYSVAVTQGATDTETDVDIGIDVAPIAKEVTLDISVGPIAFNGASV